MDDELSLADSLRKLADILDSAPKTDEWFLYPSMSQHLVGGEASNLDVVAATLGVEVAVFEMGLTSRIPGDRFCVVEGTVGRLSLRLQAHAEDYETATGKTAGEAA